jgi:LPXTG-site transpeptidase (sortase) family protein
MHTPTSFKELFDHVRLRLVPFLSVFFVTVFITYLVLYILDFYPEPVDAEVEAASAQVVAEITTMTEDAPAVVVDDPLPQRIIFDALDNRSVEVLNPQSTDIAALDAALLEGAVRHPQSADFEETGNIFILGHSSYLPNVLNRNFQAFNGIQELAWGDTIRLQSSDTEYVYRVDRVYEAKASEVVVPVDGTEPMLTLATCDSFGSLDDRFIVEASLIETRPL